MAYTLSNMGDLWRQRKDVAQAESSLMQAIALFQESGDRHHEAITAITSAELLMDSGHDGVAAATSLCADSLGKSAFDDAWQRGVGLSVAGAVRQMTTLAHAIEVQIAATGMTPDHPTEPSAIPNPLTEREMEVLHLLAEGKSSPEIVEALYISPRTATTHVTHILAKLDVSSRSGAVAAAIRRGLV